MTDHQQAAIEAVIAEVEEHSWLTVPDEGSECACGFALTEFPLEYAGDAYWQHVASCLIAAAEPHLRRKWAEEEAAKLAKTTVGLAAILDRFLENAEWESSGEEMAQRIIESVQNSLLEGAGE